jgi:hypothetical protein
MHRPASRHFRRLRTSTASTHACSLRAVIDDRVYWSENDELERDQTAGTPLKAVEVPNGTVSETNMGELWEALRATPHALITGDSFADGEVVNERVNDEGVYFVADGSSLVLRRFVEAGPGDADDGYAYGGFDTVARPLQHSPTALLVPLPVPGHLRDRLHGYAPVSRVITRRVQDPEARPVDLGRRGKRLRCPWGRSTRAVYDRSRRSWRGLDLSASKVTRRAEIRRLHCRRCDRVRTEEVPWARPGARFTRDFEDVVGPGPAPAARRRHGLGS